MVAASGRDEAPIERAATRRDRFADGRGHLFARRARVERVMGQRAEIDGQSIQVRFNQLYHDWENYIIVEVEVPPSEKGNVHKIASAKARYIDMEDHEKHTLKSNISVEFTGDKKAVASSTDTEMMISCITLIGVENSNKAVHLRDQGKTVFFSSHELSEIELVCDHLAIIVKGRIVADGPVDQLVKQGENLEKFFMSVVRDST